MTQLAAIGKPKDAARDPVRHFEYIDALRGVAVLLVILYHAGMIAGVGATYTLAGRLLHGICVQGRFGVPLFYMLSAFTLFHSMDSRAGRDLHPTRAFFVRRLFRIAPLFWLTAAFELWWYGTAPRPTAPDGVSAADIARTLAFVHGWWPDTINAVVNGGWSIGVEMAFYCLLPLLHRFATTPGRAGVAFLAALGVATAAAQFRLADRLFPGFGPDSPLMDFFVYAWLPNQLPIFLLGVVVYRLAVATSPDGGMEVRVDLNALGWAAFCLVMAAASVPLIGPREPAMQTAAVAAVGIWCLSARPFPLLVNRFTAWMGTISYGCYLLHFPALDIARRLLDMPPAPEYSFRSAICERSVPALVHLAGRPVPLRLGAVLAVTLALTALVSYAAHVLVEKPMIGLGRRLIARAPRAEDR